MAGRFITFEGIEGSGKSTQIARLAHVLRGEGAAVTVSREPGGSPIGDAIRTILLDPANTAMAPMTELLLYSAGRAQHVAEVITPALTRGDVVLVDRFADSTRAYQGAARQIDATVVERITAQATGGLEPDQTFLIDLPVDIGLARVKERQGPGDRLEQESKNFHEAVRQAYLTLAEKHAGRFIIIDGTKNEDEIHRMVVENIRTHAHTHVRT
jgi:dTMP kinase